MPRPELSLVIPVFNEEEDLPKVDVRLKELLSRLGGDVEVVFVDDGSRDRTMDRLLALAGHDARYRAISLSRRFGRERAIAAGLDRTRGRAVIITDTELQPPEVFLETVEKWKAGFDVVFGRRRSSSGGSFGAALVRTLFAALMPIEVPLENGELRLLSRRVVATLRSLRETHQSPRALIAWAGFRQATVEFDRLTAEKTVGFGELLSRALNGIGAFSTRPLRVATWAGALLAFSSVALGIVAVVVGVGFGAAILLLLFSIQFLLIGILGEYVGRIYEQVKRRPLYVVAQRIGFGSKKRVEKLATRDIEELPSFPRVPSVPPVPPVVPQHASKPPSDVPPPPPAVVAAGAAAERAISQPRQRAASAAPPERASVTPAPPPERPSVTPAPPVTGSAKPPPLKLSSSLGSMPAAPAAPAMPERASTPPVAPRRPSFASHPHPAAGPTPTPSTPPALGKHRVSRPPSLPKFPAAPSGPPRPPSMSRMPAIPRPDATPASTPSPSNAPAPVAPTDDKKG